MKLSNQRRKYIDANGRPLPGVTTVLNIIDKPGLKTWAWKQGRKNVSLHTASEPAISIGNVAHRLVESFLTGEAAVYEPNEVAYVEQATPLARRAIDHYKAEGYQLVLAEQSFISNRLRCAGTIDALAMHPRRGLTLIDIKTSKAIYDDYVRQLAAYRELIDETAEVKVDGASIIRMGKDGSFETRDYTNAQLDVGKGVFLAALDLYYALRAEREAF